MDRDGDDAARFACLASTAVSGHERLKLLERGVAGRGLAVLSGADESEDAHVAKISPSSTLWTRMYDDDYVNETVPGWDVRLAVMLLRAIAGNDDSATFDWRAYRAFLPRLDELTHLGCFDDAEASVLSPWFAEERNQIRRAWDDAYATAMASRALPPGTTGEEFRWAAAIARTRAFRLPPPPPSSSSRIVDADVAVLVPILDMANHASDGSETIRWTEATNGEEPAIALFPTRRGGADADAANAPPSPPRWREVRLSYLPKGSNEDLFRAFGFVERGNPHDALPIWVECACEREVGRTRAAPRGRARPRRVTLLAAAGLKQNKRTGALRFADVNDADDLGEERAERRVAATRALLAFSTRGSVPERERQGVGGRTLRRVLEDALDIALQNENEFDRAYFEDATVADMRVVHSDRVHAARAHLREQTLLIAAAVDVLHLYKDHERASAAAPGR